MTTDTRCADLQVIERLLNTINLLPDCDPRKTNVAQTPSEREQQLAPFFDRLNMLEDELLGRWEQLRDIWSLANPEHGMPRWDEHWMPTCLSVAVWSASPERYSEGRWALKRFLEDFRDACASLDAEDIARVLLRDDLPTSSTKWEDLNPRRKAVVRYMLGLERGATRTGPALWDVMEALLDEDNRCDFDNFKRDLAAMRTGKLLANRKGNGGGYWLREVPEGIPVSSGSAEA